MLGLVIYRPDAAASDLHASRCASFAVVATGQLWLQTHGGSVTASVQLFGQAVDDSVKFM